MSSLNLNVNNITNSGTINITNTTASSSNVTGALVVSGGIGSSNAIYANGFFINGNTAAFNSILSLTRIQYTGTALIVSDNAGPTTRFSVQTNGSNPAFVQVSQSYFEVTGAISGTPSLTGKCFRTTSNTFTDSVTAISGSASDMAFHSFSQPTLAATNATVTTVNASTLYIAGEPIAGSNQTITNSYALNVNSGNSRFNGNITISNTTDSTSSSNGGSATFLGGLAVAKQLFVGTTVTANTFTSTVSTGTSPFTISSSTNVPNLNASTLNSFTFASPGSVGGTSPGSAAFTTITSSGINTLNNATSSSSSSTGALVLSSGSLAIGNTTDSISVSNGGSCTLAGGIAVAKNGYFGLNVFANNHINAFATTVTAAGTTTLTGTSSALQYFTGSTTQSVTLPVASTLSLGFTFTIVNKSSGVVTVQSSGNNSIQAMAANTSLIVTCLLTSGTTAANWSANYSIDTSFSGDGSLITNSSSTGSVTVTLGSQTANTIFAAPNGSSGTPTFRTLVGADLNNTLTLTGTSTADTFTSTVTTGTSPFTITSTTNVPNLNASTLNGFTFASPGNIGSSTRGSGQFTTVNSNGIGFFSSLESGSTITVPYGSFFKTTTTNANIFRAAYSNSLGTTSYANQDAMYFYCPGTAAGSSSSALWAYNSTKFDITTPLILQSTTDSSSSSSGGACTLAGGLAVGKNGYFGLNIYANNHVSSYSTTATAAGVTVLTVSSSALQYFTGSTTQTVTLPNVSTLSQGFTFTIVNKSSGTVTVQSSGNNSIQAMAANTSLTVTCILTSGTTEASWSANYSLSVNVTSFSGDGSLITNSSSTGSVTVTLGSQTGNTIFAAPNGSSGTPTFRTLVGADLNNTLTLTGSSTADTFTSTVTTGTSPFTISSSTNVPNLNASTLNSFTFASPGSIGSTSPGSAVFTTINSSGINTLSNTTSSSSSSTGALVLSSGSLAVGNTTDSSSSSNGGCATLAGGLAVGKSVYIGSSTVVGNTINPSSNSGGSLNISGDVVLGSRVFLQSNALSGAAPTFTTRSTGTAIVVYPQLTASLTDYAIGVSSNNIWYSTAGNSTNNNHIWYGGTTNVMQVSGVGVLTVFGTVGSSSSSTGSMILPTGGLAIGKTTDATSSANGGSATLAGGLAVAKNGYFGLNIYANNNVSSYSTTATAAGVTVLTVSSSALQYFTGSTTQTVTLPNVSTLSLGFTFTIVNKSSGTVTVQSSGNNSIQAMAANTNLTVTCILTSGTTAASWSANYSINVLPVTSFSGDGTLLSNSSSTGGVTATLVSQTGNTIFAAPNGSSGTPTFRTLVGGDLNNTLTLTGSSTANTFTSTVTTGTSPFTISSTTNVPNLNASTLNSFTFASPGSIGGTSPGSAVFTTISASGVITSTVSTGTSPFTISSTTNVPNLNASTLNGVTFASPGSIGGTSPGSAVFTTITSSGINTLNNATSSSSSSTGALVLSSGSLAIGNTTDSSSSTNGGCATLAGGLAVGKNMYVGNNIFTNNVSTGYTTTATAAGTTVLTVTSSSQQFFTGTSTQTVTLPVTSTLTLGFSFTIVNNSTGTVTVQSSGANSVQAMAAGTSATFICILTSGTTAASWYVSGYLNLASPGPIGSSTASSGAFTTISASGIITSTVSTGTSPFTISSTTNVPNLNASTLNSFTFASPGSIGSSTASSGAFTTISASDTVSFTNTATVSANLISAFAASLSVGNFVTQYVGVAGSNNNSAVFGFNYTAAGSNSNYGFLGTYNVNTTLKFFPTGQVQIPNTTASTSSTTGTLIVGGGLGISNTIDAVSVSNGGSATLAGGLAVAKNMYVGNNIYANNFASGYTTTATAAGTTVLTGTSSSQQFFTGTSTQTVTLPVTSTLTLGFSFTIVNNSTGTVTVQSSGANSVKAMAAGTSATFICILTSGTTAASWYVSGYLNLASPGPIGSSTASSGAFTTISASGIVTITNTTSPLSGSTSNAVSSPIGAFNVNGDMTLYNIASGGGIFSFARNDVTGPPTFTTRSLGTRIVLYPNIGASSVDMAMGFESDDFWFSTYSTFSWYVNTTNVLSLSSSSFTVSQTTTSTSSTTGALILSGGLGISKTTDAVSVSNGGSATLAGGLAVAKSVFVGTSLNASHVNLGYTTTVTSASTVTLTVTSTQQQFFTGSTAQTVTLPVASTLVLGFIFHIVNLSTQSITVNSSGANLVGTVLTNTRQTFTCILTSGTTAASWTNI